MKTSQRLLLAAALALAAGPTLAATSLGPTPYLSFADSPFNGGSFVYFHLETFEDHLLNTPGVTGAPGGVTSVVFGPSIHDSVDADDGAIDGSGLQGDDWFAGNGAAGVRFTFDAGVLGQLPTHVGLVWTDGGFSTTVSFSAFGPGGELLFTNTQGGFADNSNNGETGEDRFFGVINPAGVSSILMSSPGGGIEVDHLQYGAQAFVNEVPEPGTYALMLAGLAAVGATARRRRSR